MCFCAHLCRRLSCPWWRLHGAACSSSCPERWGQRPDTTARTPPENKTQHKISSFVEQRKLRNSFANSGSYTCTATQHTFRFKCSNTKRPLSQVQTCSGWAIASHSAAVDSSQCSSVQSCGCIRWQSALLESSKTLNARLITMVNGWPGRSVLAQVSQIFHHSNTIMRVTTFRFPQCHI